MGIPQLGKIKQSVREHLDKVHHLYEDPLACDRPKCLVTGLTATERSQVPSKDQNATFLSVCVPFVIPRKISRGRQRGSPNFLTAMGLMLYSKIIRQWKKYLGIKEANLRSIIAEGEPEPMTLFQFLSPKGDPRRDLKQAMCRMSPVDDQRCLFVSQLWAFVVNDGESHHDQIEKSPSDPSV